METNNNVYTDEKPKTESKFVAKETEDKLCTEQFRIKIWNWSPDFLQRFNTVNWFLFVLCLASLTQGIIINGLSVSSLPSIQKEFGISSKSAGVIVAGNDASALILVGLVSFFGTKAHKPKWMGIGVLLTGIGGFLFASPKLMIDAYKPVGQSQDNGYDICDPNKKTLTSNCESSSESLLHVAVLFIGQLIMGAGITPLYTLGPAFLDENVTPRASPIYLGFWFASTMLGPGMGLIIGGQFLTVFTNIDQPDGMSMTPADSRWIGAWWLGFLSLSSLFFVSGILLLAFPRQLPREQKKREKAISEGQIPTSDPNIQFTIKGYIIASFKLCTNGVFMLAIFALTVKLLFVLGVAPFLVQILVVKFGVMPYKASTILGGALAPSIILGVLIGAVVMRRIKVDIAAKTAGRICLCISFVSIATSFIYILPGCKTTELAGTTTSYHNTTIFRNDDPYSKCNVACLCRKTDYEPVCGSDGITYRSPCFAGCNASIDIGNSEPRFGNCSCIPSENNYKSEDGFYNHAELGVCKRGCKNVVIFLVVFMVGLITAFTASTPHKLLLLRSVPDNQRAFALGVQFLIMRSLSFLPGPIVMGAVFDSQCISWTYDDCGERKNCMDYDIDKLSKQLTIFSLATSVISSVLYAIVVFMYPKSKTPDVVITNENAADNTKL